MKDLRVEINLFARINLITRARKFLFFWHRIEIETCEGFLGLEFNLNAREINERLIKSLCKEFSLLSQAA